MSKLITNTIRHTGGSADNITLDNSQNVTVEGNATVDGTSTLTGNVTCSGQLKTDAIRHTGASSDAITLANDGTATAKITNYPHRNLIINGAMQVHQRGTASTSNGMNTMDRWATSCNGNDEVPEQHEHGLSSSDTGPWEKGFRKSWYIRNGNQTSGAGADDRVTIQYKFEAQDIAKSGWDYTSASSYVTLQFWVMSSIAQNFYGHFTSEDGTAQSYIFETGSLSANTWKHVTVTIPGNSNITVDNDTGLGFYIEFVMFRGTNKTASGKALNTWAAFDSAARVPDMTTTWYTTDNATFELTGVQLEVGDTATDFEHRSYGDDLAKCQRYYQIQEGNSDLHIQAGKGQGTTSVDVGHALAVPLRAQPTIVCGANRVFMHNGYSDSTTTPTISSWDASKSIHSSVIPLNLGGHSSITSNYVCGWTPKSAALTFEAEL